MTARVTHAITPGDHFSPSTGSAVATVVDGLSGHAPPAAQRASVLVARGTYPDRYRSADVLEYEQHHPGPRSRHLDLVRAKLGMSRVSTQARYAPMMAGQRTWAPTVVVGHNAVQVPRLIDTNRHRTVLFAHNDLLRTYSRAEAGRALEPAEAIIAVSDFLADRMRVRLPLHLRSRVHVVRNGVDLDRFHPREAPRVRGVLQVVFVGRVIPDKGADVAIRALDALERDDIELLIVGSAGFDARTPMTPYERRLRRIGAAARGRVTFMPFMPRDEVAQILRGADIVVVPSRWPEPFALTALEGMASGATVIASDIGGIPEATMGAGLLVAPDSPHALAAAIEALADDRSLLARTRDDCLTAARTRSWGVAASEFYALLDRSA